MSSKDKDVIKNLPLALDLMLAMGMYEKFNKALKSTRDSSPIFVAAKNVIDLPELADDIDMVFAGGVIELTEATAVIYAETFSKRELKKMIKFYKSSAGKKFVSESLHIEERVVSNSMSWMTTAIARISDIVLIYSNKLNDMKDKISSAIPVSTKLH